MDIDAKVNIPNTDEPIPVVLLANKIDLVPQDGEEKGWGKTPEEMDQFCKDHGFVTWFETSAKDNVHIETASKALVTAILEKVHNVPKDEDSERVDLKPDPLPRSDNCGC